MTSQEIVDAMREGNPVQYNGIRYRRIEQYVLRINPESKRQIKSVDMLDMNGNSLVRALAENVSPMECA